MKTLAHLSCPTCRRGLAGNKGGGGGGRLGDGGEGGGEGTGRSVKGKKYMHLAE